MGYCMSLRGVEFQIKADKKEMALQAIKDLVAGDLDGGKYNLNIYDEDSILNAKTLNEALNEISWDTEEDDKGNITYMRFDGEKLGDEGVIFDAIAPYVKKGSFIEMGGEDSHIWRWVFNGKKCVEKDAVLKWD